MNHGFHEWARMVSEVGGAGDLRFERGVVRRARMERESRAKGLVGEGGVGRMVEFGTCRRVGF